MDGWDGRFYRSILKFTYTSKNLSVLLHLRIYAEVLCRGFRVRWCWTTTTTTNTTLLIQHIIHHTKQPSPNLNTIPFATRSQYSSSSIFQQIDECFVQHCCTSRFWDCETARGGWSWCGCHHHQHQVKSDRPRRQLQKQHKQRE